MLARIKYLFGLKKIQLFILILATVISYINILPNGFAWDDRDFFIDWPQIKSEPGLPAYLSVPALLKGDLPLGHLGVYRPLRSMFQVASYALFGEHPLGYHIQAIIIHILIVLVIYLITEIITKKRSIAFITGVLFATHPIHTEAVTFITASFDTLGILFFFLSFYLYLRVENETKGKQIYLVGSLIYALFAFFTYEMTLTLPVLILLYDLCTHKFSIRKLFSKAQTYALYFGGLAIYVLIRFILLGIGNRADYLGTDWAILANQGRVGMPEIFKDYLLWLVWPINLVQRRNIPISLLKDFLDLLNKIDPSGKLETLSTHLAFLFPVLYALIAIILLFFLLKKYPLIYFCMVWIIVALLPVSNIIPQGTVLAERFLYIPSFGFTFLAGILLGKGYEFFSKKRSYKILYYFLLGFLPLLVTFYSFQTIQRNTDWRNEKSIWQSLMHSDPKDPVSYAALGSIYAREGQYDKGIELLKEAIAYSGPNTRLESELGLSYEQKGDFERAIAQYNKTIAINPQFYRGHIFLGNIYQKERKYDLAIEEYKKALGTKGKDYVTLSYLGVAYHNQKNYGEAIKILRESLEINPYQSLAYLVIADSYKKLGDLQDTNETLNRGASFDPMIKDKWEQMEK